MFQSEVKFPPSSQMRLQMKVTLSSLSSDTPAGCNDAADATMGGGGGRGRGASICLWRLLSRILLMLARFSVHSIRRVETWA